MKNQRHQPEFIRVRNWVGGEFLEADQRETLEILNPASGEVIGRLPRSTASDINRAVQSAKKAFGAWSELSAQARADWLDCIADVIERHKDELARLESLDQGKPLSLSRSMDIPRAAYNFRFFAGVIRHEVESVAPLDRRTFSYVRREPVGVAGLISPWNLPLYLATWKIAPAIAYGNTCVLKPSELTSLTCYRFAELVSKLGLPKGVINIVFGTGSEAGEPLCVHPDVPLVSFTGGTSTGRRIATVAAPFFKKLSLEMGGKNATLVFEDINFDRDVGHIVRSAFLNQGEICLCGSRIYVQKSIAHAFVDRLVAEVKKLKVGDAFDEKVFMGPLVSFEHRSKVDQMVSEARISGWDVLCGGRSMEGKGAFYEPTVLSLSAGADIRQMNASRIQQEEVFGPVVSVVSFDTEDEAVELANQSRYGLSASIWTDRLSRAHSLAHQLRVGTVWINGWMVRDLRMPFGGVSESGLGREGQMDSVHFFTEPKTVCVRIPH